MKALQEYTNKDPDTKNSNFTEIQTRFGQIKVNIDKQINFPQGLLGFEDFTQFCLADYPGKNISEFKILQSIQNNDLSLLIFPLVDYENFDIIYEMKDLSEASDILGINPKNIVILGIVSIQQNAANNPDLTVNLRAPVIIDTKNFIGYQHIFLNDKYEIKYKLND